jgi:hypothetical protein
MLDALLIRANVKWTALMIAVSHLFGNSDMPLNGMAMLTLSWGWLTGFLFYRSRSLESFLAMLLLPLVMFEVGFRLPLASLVIAASAVAVCFAKEIRIENHLVKRAMHWLSNMSYPP